MDKNVPVVVYTGGERHVIGSGSINDDGTVNVTPNDSVYSKFLNGNSLMSFGYIGAISEISEVYLKSSEVCIVCLSANCVKCGSGFCGHHQ